MKSWFVGHRFLKQAKNCVSDWSSGSNAIPCRFPHHCRLLKKSVRLIRAENKRTQLCLQIELTEENHNHKSHRNKCTSRKKKIVTLNVIKKVLYAGPKSTRNILAKLSPNPAQNPARPGKPAPTYNSTPHRDRTKQVRSCNHASWFLVVFSGAFPWV